MPPMALRHERRYKAADIWDTPDDGNRYEVIDGALYVTPPPNWGHQRGLGKLHIRVGAHGYAHGLGEVVAAPVGVVLDDDNGVELDLIFVYPQQLHTIPTRRASDPPAQTT